MKTRLRSVRCSVGEKQLRLPFEPSKEEARLARVERLLSGKRRLTTTAKMFDERAYREATAAASWATTSGQYPNGG